MKKPAAGWRRIGIQVLKDGVPLSLMKYTVGRLASQETLHHHTAARAFLSVWPDTSTGEVESHMIFNLTYD
jgi:hypothetical protein